MVVDIDDAVVRASYFDNYTQQIAAYSANYDRQFEAFAQYHAASIAWHLAASRADSNGWEYWSLTDRAPMRLDAPDPFAPPQWSGPTTS